MTAPGLCTDGPLHAQVLTTNASKYSKGILSEILEFVMGKGLIPADGEVWKTRRRCAHVHTSCADVHSSTNARAL
jgi:hypothetical protein